MRTLLFILGTRPEAIKLSPLALHFRKFPSDFDVKVCLTGQHREIVHQALKGFGLTPDIDLDLPDRLFFNPHREF